MAHAGMSNAIERCSSSAPSRSIPATAAGVIQEFNRRAVELWGCEPVLGDTDKRFCGSFKLFRPDGTYMPHDQCPMAEVVAGTLSEAADAEVLIERPDGSRITVIVNIRPLKNRARRRHRSHQLFLRHHIAQTDRGRPAPEPRGRHADAAGEYAPAAGRRFFAAAARHPGCGHRDHRRPDGQHPVARG